MNTMIQANVETVIFGDRFAKNMVYYPVSGSPQVIKGIPVFDKEMAEDGETVVDFCILRVMASDIERPEYRDRVSIRMPSGSFEDWYVEQILGSDGYIWRVKLYQEKRAKL